jgi:ABC-2 type transport system ATP-binding protein
MNLLEIRNLRKSFARDLFRPRVEVLKGLNITVPDGTITGFLGANGAGKTTSMRCVLGLDFPDSGEILMFGKPPSVETNRRIGFLPERPYFYEHLTGREFLEFYANLSGVWKAVTLRERIRELLKRVDLEFAQDRRLRAYSKGMLQKIGVAQALIHSPELVILDEPMSGLDPDGRLALADIILETAKKGTAVFFTSHLLHDTERLCQRLVVLKDGISIYEGTTEALLERGGMKTEITFLATGEQKSQIVGSQDELQLQLKQLIQNGAQIIEVKRTRLTLEETFVNMALRGGKT